LLQLPHVTRATLERCKAESNASLKGEDVATVFDLMALEDDVRDDVLRLGPSEMADVAAFCNAYPNVELEYVPTSNNRARKD
jgi:pre-mRNA-splicing helicase BRR2